MAINMNTVWAVAVSPLLFRSRLSAANGMGVVLSTVGTYLCTTTRAKADRTAAAVPAATPGVPLLSWLTPGLLASVSLTAVEMGGRMLVSAFDADAAIFTQAQLVFAGMVSAVRLLRFPQGFVAGMNEVPLAFNAALAVWRVKWLVWIAQAVQIAPNPGIAKTIMGGGDTVIATLVGVVAFGSELTAANILGIAMSVVGTYLCVG